MVNKKAVFFWNMMGSLTNAAASVILLMAVTRSCGAAVGGVFSIAFAIAQLMLTIGGYEMRPYQSTDVTEQFSFRHYFTSRLFTCFLMLLTSSCIILFSGYTGSKAAAIFLMCAYKMVDALSDVFHGMFQQKERLDLAGKSLAIRTVLSTTAFCVVIYMQHSLVLATAVALVVALGWFFAYDLSCISFFTAVRISSDWKTVSRLLMVCLPLFAGSFMLMYIFNAPKYAMERFMAPEYLTYYNILFMPASVINLFSIFLFRPLLTTLASSWIENDRKRFLTIVSLLVFWILIVTVGAVAAAYFLGIPVLSWLYAEDLSAFRPELLMVMFGGGLSAASTILYYVITVMRRQFSLLIGYGITCALSLFLAPLMVRGYGIRGAALSYIIAMAVLLLAFLTLFLFHLKRSSVPGKKEEAHG